MKHIVKKFIGAVIKLSVMAVLAEVFFESLSEPGDVFPYGAPELRLTAGTVRQDCSGYNGNS